MCASVCSSLLLLTLLNISIIFGAKMSTEGLPLARQERGADRGLLAGADFLSVFMSSSLRQAYLETTTEEAAYTRAVRSTSILTPPPTARATPEGVVLAVRVSSSVGNSLIHKNQETTTPEAEGTTEHLPDQRLVASEEHPSIVAESKKSEFSVEESEPITTNSDLTADFFKEYPASVQPIPRPFLAGKEKLQPIQQTVIYHNNPREPGRARSVSYSTVIQAVPHEEKHWDEEKHERRERHFDGTQTLFENNFHEEGEKVKLNDSGKFLESGNEQFVTIHPHTPPKNELSWSKNDDGQTTRRNSFTTERNWELQEKNYAQSHLPAIYAKPEQNYEIDESASVMTNGRIHGVQVNPTVPSKQEVKIGESKKTDDNQKVGYVVEGRNYRKYRVEERTSDGFIVGEYGVVSHDDGSLRGVRYTADGTISPRLIYDALMKFLSL